MPKRPVVFNEFHKGIDSATSPRDIKKGYLADVVNMMVDEVGIIRTMGGIENHYAQGDTSQPTVTISEGKGLYAFSHDRLEGEQAATTDGVPSGTAAAETSDDYLAVATAGTDAYIYINSLTTGAFGVKASIDLGTDAGMIPTFHSFDGGLRVSDGAFNAANRTKWFGYIDRRKFRTATTPTYNYTDDSWYSKNNDLAPPLASGTFIESDGSLETTGTTGEVNVKMHITEVSAKPESEWQKKWECGVTYIYDGTQETLVTKLTTDGTTVDIYDLSGTTDLSSARFEIQIFGDSTNRVNERLTHVKVYIRESGTQEWFVQGVWDLQEGGRLINGDTNQLWTAVDTTNDYYKSFNTITPQPIPQILHTWESETGLFNDEKSIDIGQLGDGYLCSVVMGRTVYVGNVKRENFEGETIIEADAIYKSIPDQPDTFPASWRIDAAINDGEGITALHKWGSDLLQFKHRTLYIIDTSGEIEVLKPNGTLKKAGARNSAIITETPYGIVWANEWGLWLWNGELQNLLSQDALGSEFQRFQTEAVNIGGGVMLIGLGTIEQSTWSTFINSNSYLGYYAYKQQIIIGDNSTVSGAGNIYIYDFRTGSMVRGLAKFTASQKHTNFVTDSNDDLVIAHTTGTIVKWGDTETATSNQEVVFPEIGTAGKLFRTKECSVTYKSSETQATPLYYKTLGSDGEPGTWTAFASENFLDTGDGTSESFHRLVFDASSFLETEFIQLKLDFPSSGIIQIDDVTLSIRPLSFKRVS